MALNMFRKLTGREPTEKELTDLKKKVEKNRT